MHAARLSVLGSAAVVFGAAWLVWRDPVAVILCVVAAVSAGHAAWAVFRRPLSVVVGLSLDSLALLIGIAVMRPPAGAVIGLAVYGALATLAFAPRRAAVWIAISVSAGAAVVMGVANVLAPRSWSQGAAIAIVAVSVVVSTGAVLWVMRIVADGLDERGRLARGRAESERSQRRAEREMTLVLDAAAEGIYGVDADGVCTFVNRAVTDILGWEPSDLVGRRMHDVVHSAKPDGSPYPVEECAIALAGIGDGFASDEEVYVAADGSLIPIALNLRPMPGADGGTAGAVVSFRSIANEIAARDQLRFQASLLDNVGSAVIVWDLDGTITSWNRGAVAMYGWEASEVLGRSIFEVVSAEIDPADIESELERLLVEGLFQAEYTVHRRDGSPFPVLSTVVVLRDHSGEPVGFLDVGVDVTEQRRIEAEAREQGDLARGVLDSVDYPVCVVDSEGVIVAVNRAWEAFGADNGGDPATAGAGVSYLEAVASVIDDDDARSAADGLADILAGRATSFDLEYPCHGPDQQRWFRMSVTPLSGIGAVVTHWDTSLERRARGALEEVVAAKDRFVAIVSHEFRTPLTVVLGLAEELRDGEFGAEETAEFHRIIADQARDLSHLVEDLLVAARVDADSMVSSVGVVDLGAQVAAVVESLPADIGVSADLAALDLHVLADESRVRQVLRNLVTNALRHGAPPIDITATAAAGGGVAIEVVDHGSGVPSELIDTLFEPYTRSEQSKTASQSIGLGLFVSHQLARGMGGDLTYERRGDASVFTVTLVASGGSVASGSAGDMAAASVGR